MSETTSSLHLTFVNSEHSEIEAVAESAVFETRMFERLLYSLLILSAFIIISKININMKNPSILYLSFCIFVYLLVKNF